MSRRRGKSRQSLLVALALLAAVIASWWYFTARGEEVRQETLAGVPDFPEPGQLPQRREPNQKLPVRAPPMAPPPAPRKLDRLNNFALAPAHTVSVIQVNALFNTPLFDRFHACAPHELAALEKAMQDKGLDLEKDIDRVAIVPDGFAVSGFFDGKPIAETLATSSQSNPDVRTYRDTTIYSLANRGCVAQMGNLVLIGPAGDVCDQLVDRALDPPADPEAAQELYGDLYVRSDLGASGVHAAAAGKGDPLGDLLGELSGVTLRANVWDDVALSLEGTPADAAKLQDLTQMARGALALAKSQLDDDDVKLQALSDLAKVQGTDGKLQIDLALPADQLFERMRLPCPGLDDAGAR